MLDYNTELDIYNVTSEDVEFLRQGVSNSTAKSYKYKIVEWDRFKQKFGYEHDMVLDKLPFATQRIVLVKFIRHLHESKVSPNVIGSILASVQFILKVHCKDIKVFTDPTIQMARRAVQPSQRSESLRKEKSKRYPVTLDMLTWLREDYFVRGNIDDKMTYLGCILGFTFIWRVSQYVSDNKFGHAILSEDVRFKLLTGEIKRPWELMNIAKSRVECIVFIVRSNKQRGNETQHLYLGRKSVKETQLLEDLVDWCRLSEIKEGDPFMSRYMTNRGKVTQKRLTRKMVSTALKVVASAFGFDKVHFAPHCLRIGAATAGKAKGGRAFVKDTAGWSDKSDTDQRYEHGTPLDDNALSISRTCFSILTAEQVRTMMSVSTQPSKPHKPDPRHRRSALGETL